MLYGWLLLPVHSVLPDDDRRNVFSRSLRVGRSLNLGLRWRSNWRWIRREACEVALSDEPWTEEQYAPAEQEQDGERRTQGKAKGSEVATPLMCYERAIQKRQRSN